MLKLEPCYTEVNMKSIEFANVIIQDAAGNVLVLWRSKTHPSRPLEIDLPGGGVEEGETYEHAIIREVEEETGLKIQVEGLRLVYEKSLLRRSGEHIHGKVYSLQISDVTPNLAMSWEHDHYSWVAESELVGFSHFHQKAIDHGVARGVLRGVEVIR